MTIRRQRSGRYQASYVGPDKVRHFSTENYHAKADAEGWLRDERRLIEWNEWIDPRSRNTTGASAVNVAGPDLQPDVPTFDSYARQWIQNRVTTKGAPLHPRTRVEYLAYLDGLLASVASRPINEVSATDIARWHGAHANTPSMRRVPRVAVAIR